MGIYYAIVTPTLLLLAVTVLFIAQTIKYQRERGKRLKNLGVADIYNKKLKFMNNSEQTLFEMLEKGLDTQFRILPQVNLLSFINTNNEFGNVYEEIDTLRHFTVDFLVIDRRTTEPKLVVELDGKSHEGYSKKNRDHYVNTVCGKCNLLIKHIKVGEDFEFSIKDINLLSDS